MPSIAIVDNKDAPTIAVWITTRVAPLAVSNVNAVVVDTAIDPQAHDKVRLLTRDRAVLLTRGSRLDGLPVEGDPLTVADIASLVSETAEEQQRILSAVAGFAMRPNPKTGHVPKKPRKIVLPEFPAAPNEFDFMPTEDTPVGRTLATANYLARAWSLWLQTDEERRKRAVDAKGRPWMMPDDMSCPQIVEVPKKFGSRLCVQALV